MAHFAKINEQKMVVEVLVIGNEQVDNLPFPESEAVGQAFIASCNITGEWLQTSYNGNFRKQYCGTGYYYNAEADVFVAPQPFPSWTLDENSDWQPPVARPEDDKIYTWSEDDLTWKETTTP